MSLLLLKYFQRCNVFVRITSNLSSAPRDVAPGDLWPHLLHLAALHTQCASARIYVSQQFPHIYPLRPPPNLLQTWLQSHLSLFWPPYGKALLPPTLLPIPCPCSVFLHYMEHWSTVCTICCYLLVPGTHRAHAWQILLNKATAALWRMDGLESFQSKCGLHTTVVSIFPQQYR